MWQVARERNLLTEIDPASVCYLLEQLAVWSGICNKKLHGVLLPQSYITTHLRGVAGFFQALLQQLSDDADAEKVKRLCSRAFALILRFVRDLVLTHTDWFEEWVVNSGQAVGPLRVRFMIVVLSLVGNDASYEQWVVRHLSRLLKDVGEWNIIPALKDVPGELVRMVLTVARQPQWCKDQLMPYLHAVLSQYKDPLVLLRRKDTRQRNPGWTLADRIHTLQVRSLGDYHLAKTLEEHFGKSAAQQALEYKWKKVVVYEVDPLVLRDIAAEIEWGWELPPPPPPKRRWVSSAATQNQDTATADDHVADGDDDDEADPEVFEHMLEIDEDDENMGELPDMEAETFELTDELTDEQLAASDRAFEHAGKQNKHDVQIPEWMVRRLRALAEAIREGLQESTASERLAREHQQWLAGRDGFESAKFVYKTHLLPIAVRREEDKELLRKLNVKLVALDDSDSRGEGPRLVIEELEDTEDGFLKRWDHSEEIFASGTAGLQQLVALVRDRCDLESKRTRTVKKLLPLLQDLCLDHMWLRERWVRRIKELAQVAREEAPKPTNQKRPPPGELRRFPARSWQGPLRKLTVKTAKGHSREAPTKVKVEADQLPHPTKENKGAGKAQTATASKGAPPRTTGAAAAENVVKRRNNGGGSSTAKQPAVPAKAASLQAANGALGSERTGSHGGAPKQQQAPRDAVEIGLFTIRMTLQAIVRPPAPGERALKDEGCAGRWENIPNEFHDAMLRILGFSRCKLGASLVFSRGFVGLLETWTICSPPPVFETLGLALQMQANSLASGRVEFGGALELCNTYVHPLPEDLEESICIACRRIGPQVDDMLSSTLLPAIVLLACEAALVAGRTAAAASEFFSEIAALWARLSTAERKRVLAGLDDSAGAGPSGAAMVHRSHDKRVQVKQLLSWLQQYDEEDVPQRRNLYSLMVNPGLMLGAAMDNIVHDMQLPDPACFGCHPADQYQDVDPPLVEKSSRTRVSNTGCEDLPDEMRSAMMAVLQVVCKSQDDPLQVDRSMVQQAFCGVKKRWCGLTAEEQKKWLVEIQACAQHLPMPTWPGPPEWLREAMRL